MNLKIKQGTPHFYQWDVGQQVIVEDAAACNEVHFPSKQDEGTLVCKIKEENGLRVADVPNVLLQTATPVKAYLCCHTPAESTILYNTSFQVHSRLKPENYVYTQTETLNYTNLDNRISDLEKQMNDQVSLAVQDALAQAKESGQFDGADGTTPQKGVDYFTEGDKAEMVTQVLAAMPTWNGGSY